MLSKPLVSILIVCAVCYVISIYLPKTMSTGRLSSTLQSLIVLTAVIASVMMFPHSLILFLVCCLIGIGLFLLGLKKGGGPEEVTYCACWISLLAYDLMASVVSMMVDPRQSDLYAKHYFAAFVVVGIVLISFAMRYVNELGGISFGHTDTSPRISEELLERPTCFRSVWTTYIVPVVRSIRDKLRSTD
jgi:drug/metabolite transporter (DMT)-like permease